MNTLNKEYNPLTTYVCNDGDLHINHCSSGQICGDNDDECEYKNSGNYIEIPASQVHHVQLRSQLLTLTLLTLTLTLSKLCAISG